MTDTGTNAAPMRLRAEAPRVTRLSRIMLASVAAVALVGIGGSLIYALQTRGPDDGGTELYSTNNRQTADGLAGFGGTSRKTVAATPQAISATMSEIRGPTRRTIIM